jgi:hypothetical protein
MNALRMIAIVPECGAIRRAQALPITAVTSFHTGWAEARRSTWYRAGSVNIGAFRRLENEAAKNPGALYFMYRMYAPGTAQEPMSVEHGLLVRLAKSLIAERILTDRRRAGRKIT